MRTFRNVRKRILQWKWMGGSNTFTWQRISQRRYFFFIMPSLFECNWNFRACNPSMSCCVKSLEISCFFVGVKAYVPLEDKAPNFTRDCQLGPPCLPSTVVWHFNHDGLSDLAGKKQIRNGREKKMVSSWCCLKCPSFFSHLWLSTRKPEVSCFGTTGWSILINQAPP